MTTLPPPPDLGPEWTPYWRDFMVRTLIAYGEACAAVERERIAQWLDSEHERRKHLDNYAGYYARKIRAMKESK